jgi:hypothetical protein
LREHGTKKAAPETVLFFLEIMLRKEDSRIRAERGNLSFFPFFPFSCKVALLRKFVLRPRG